MVASRKSDTMQTNWNSLPQWQRETIARQTGCSPLETFDLARRIFWTLALLAAIAGAIYLGSMKPTPQPEIQRTASWIPTNWIPSWIYMRTNRPYIPTPGGSVGIRV